MLAGPRLSTHRAMQDTEGGRRKTELISKKQTRKVGESIAVRQLSQDGQSGHDDELNLCWDFTDLWKLNEICTLTGKQKGNCH